MAVNLKTQEEIETMKAGGKILAGVMERLKTVAKPGIKTAELDALAEQLITEAGCQISFRTVRDYQWTTCMCVNDVVVHGIPNGYILKDGDLLGIDVGLIKDGLHLDMAETVLIGNPANLSNGSNLTNLLDVGKRTLAEAIKMAKPGNRIGHISETIEKNISAAGYCVVRNLVGHGVGKVLHEEPAIPGVLKGKIEETPEIVPGMTLAIEVIYNRGGPEIIYAPDGWTIKSGDGSLSATFEKTLAVLEDEPIVLTC